MIKSGETYRNYVTGEAITFTRTAAETQGKYIEIRARYKPRQKLAPIHYHPNQTETFKVREGKLRTVINGIERIYSAGEEFTIAAGIPHGMCNGGDIDVIFDWHITPALKTDRFFANLWGELQRKKKARPSLLQMILFLKAYKNEFVLSKPPKLIQKILIGTLAPIATLAGLKANYRR